MEPEGSSPHLQAPAKRPYPEHNPYFSDNIKDAVFCNSIQRHCQRSKKSACLNTTPLSTLQKQPFDWSDRMFKIQDNSPLIT